jgi:hypothetical protein
MCTRRTSDETDTWKTSVHPVAVFLALKWLHLFTSCHVCSVSLSWHSYCVIDHVGVICRNFVLWFFAADIFFLAITAFSLFYFWDSSLHPKLFPPFFIRINKPKLCSVKRNPNNSEMGYLRNRFHPRVGNSIKWNTIENVFSRGVAETLIRRSGKITKSSNFKYYQINRTPKQSSHKWKLALP